MSRDAPQPPDANAWQAQYLRCISFPVAPQNAVNQNWWRELTGADRETRVEKRREVEEEGTVDGIALNLSIDLLRIQWSAAPRLSADSLPEGFPTLGPFLQWRGWFRDLMHRWFPLSPEIRRLAFAGVLLQPVRTRDEGYELLNSYLRWLDLDPQATDFLYRINRKVPSNSGVEGLEINRLMTWSVGRFAILVRSQLIGELAEGAGAQTDREERLACVLELDINTVPEPRDRVLPRHALPQIFDELLDRGLEIAARGDYRP